MRTDIQFQDILVGVVVFVANDLELFDLGPEVEAVVLLFGHEGIFDGSGISIKGLFRFTSVAIAEINVTTRASMGESSHAITASGLYIHVKTLRFLKRWQTLTNSL